MTSSKTVPTAANATAGTVAGPTGFPAVTLTPPVIFALHPGSVLANDIVDLNNK